jgi:hypothetical protein
LDESLWGAGAYNGFGRRTVGSYCFHPLDAVEGRSTATFTPTGGNPLLHDGENYFSGGIVRKKSLKDIPALQYQEYIFNGHWNARYIKMKVKAGDGGMSVDEIIVM